MDRNAADRVAQPHAEHGGHLVVAGAPRAQAPADLGTDAVDQATLHRAVHVLVGGKRAEGAVGNVTAELVRRGYGATEIEAMWSGNFLRLLTAAETYADAQRDAA